MKLICSVQIQKSKSSNKAIPAQGVLMMCSQASAVVKLHDKLPMILLNFDIFLSKFENLTGQLS
jgi:hypothetical protein